MAFGHQRRTRSSALGGPGNAFDPDALADRAAVRSVTEELGPRSRAIRWHDPAPLVEAARSRTGLELLRAIAAGELPAPPVAELLAMRLVAVEPAHAVFEFDPAEYMYNPLGGVHGGILTTLLDSAMGCALQTTLPVGATYTTLELKVNFLRPVTDRSGTLRAEGTLVHAGGTIAVAEARLVDGRGQRFAHATSTLLVRRAPSA